MREIHQMCMSYLLRLHIEEYESCATSRGTWCHGSVTLQCITNGQTFQLKLE